MDIQKECRSPFWKCDSKKYFCRQINKSKYSVSGNSRTNKIVISNEPIKLIVKNKERRKDMMANSRPKENIT